MARHLWREDIEQRIAIRTLKDTTRGITTKALRDKFGVSTNIISAALEKTVAEWKALAVSTPYRARVREPPCWCKKPCKCTAGGGTHYR